MRGGIAMEESWEYEKDNDHLMCKCPTCGGRMMIYRWTYDNPYHFCPYCGTPLKRGEFLKEYLKVYGG